MRFGEKERDFLRSDHTGMIEGLNRISDDLLKAKWYFLAAIAAIGLAYKYLFEINKLIYFVEIQRDFMVIMICLLGNIIFWLMSEYALSHGFLFRFMQFKLATIEKEFYQNQTSLDKTIQNPTSEKRYFYLDEKYGLRLRPDYIIPDQFVPLYWASFWAIIINTIVAFNLNSKAFTFDNIEETSLKLLVFSVISIPLIWKLWTYHIHRINSFIKKHCRFEIVSPVDDKESFFEFPHAISLFGLLIAGMLCIILTAVLMSIPIYLFLYLLLIGYYWPFFAGLILHVLRIPLQLYFWLQKTKLISPPVSHNCTKYYVSIERSWTTKIRWALCLLYWVV